MDKEQLMMLTDTSIVVGVVHDHLERLSSYCSEAEDILSEILGDETFSSFREIVESTDKLLEKNARAWLKDKFNYDE